MVSYASCGIGPLLLFHICSYILIIVNLILIVVYIISLFVRLWDRAITSCSTFWLTIMLIILMV
ncbi:hypothetical protein C2G38_2084614 [Gigaspora rosea]|uniref:Uncharacterized protein n=1 Tax=Gigaspora rosea TaxID=44941 RepID=A0A397V8V9_9GLOM|nr:hypothetical protein C2G38_2084614 [Gigaspora rosea]